MTQEEKLLEVFADYLEKENYYEILYSKKRGHYISLTENDEECEVEDITDYEELATLVIKGFLDYIYYSEEFREERKLSDEPSEKLYSVFWDRLTPYIEQIPELEEIASEVEEDRRNNY